MTEKTAPVEETTPIASLLPPMRGTGMVARRDQNEVPPTAGPVSDSLPSVIPAGRVRALPKPPTPATPVDKGPLRGPASARPTASLPPPEDDEIDLIAEDEEEEEIDSGVEEAEAPMRPAITKPAPAPEPEEDLSFDSLMDEISDVVVDDPAPAPEPVTVETESIFIETLAEPEEEVLPEVSHVLHEMGGYSVARSVHEYEAEEVAPLWSRHRDRDERHSEIVGGVGTTVGDAVFKALRPLLPLERVNRAQRLELRYGDTVSRFLLFDLPLEEGVPVFQFDAATGEIERAFAIPLSHLL